MFKVVYAREILKDALDVYFNGSTPPNPSKFYLILCQFYRGVVAGFSTSTGEVLLSSHNLSIGSRVRFIQETGAILPSAFSDTNDYYVVESTSNSIKLSFEPSDAPIIPTNTGAGIIYAQEVGTSTDPISTWTTRELPAGIGYNRTNFNPGNATNSGNTEAKLPQIIPTFIPTQDISFNYIALLKNANSEVKDTAGQIVFFRFVGQKVIEAYGRVSIPLDVYARTSS